MLLSRCCNGYLDHVENTEEEDQRINGESTMISDESILLFIYIMVAIGLVAYVIVQWELKRMTMRIRKERVQ